VGGSPGLSPLRGAMLAALLATGVAPAASGELAELEAKHEAAIEELGQRGAYDALRKDFEALAKSGAGTEEGLGAELWLLRMHWWQRPDGTMESGAATLARRLLDEYPTSASLKRIPEFDYLFDAADFENICGRLTQVTPHTEVKAWCLFATGKKLVRSAPERAPEFFRILREKYGEVPYRATTFGEIAAAYLDRHDPADLEPGKLAPEIIGVDTSGQPMRLSDYRGKVVVLDFWGDW